MNLTVAQTMVGVGTAFLVGLAKTGVPGAVTVIVPFMASAFGAKASVGLVLPTLITGDILALAVYRRFARWGIILRVLPYSLLGILVGVYLLGGISDLALKRAMGALVLALLTLQHVLQRYDIAGARAAKACAPVLGFLAGVSTAMANAAGPLVTVYLLWMDVRKEEFVGSAAWYFFIVNCIKVPFLAYLGLITAGTVRLNLLAVPIVVAGALCGVWLLKVINQRVFTVLVQFLAGVAAIKLLVGG